MSLIVKIGKKGKAMAKRVLSPVETHHISYTRRIERVSTDRRILAMTFDDGPADLPCSPDLFDGRSLTDVILDILEEYGARGTFDVVGDTSDNYPDKPGAPGSAAWGGTRYDHYPDFGRDASGGAVHNDRLIRRILDGGHQITNHGYRHIIFGKKPFVYGKRVFLGSFDGALEDISRLHRYISDKYGYEITMGRPPHYVDRVQGGLTSYDVYDAMGYQYMAASFDGAGWLPATAGDAQAAFEEEVRAMTEPMKAALEKDPDFFCGQIVFQKDGCNMARRTPVAVGLRRQLEILASYGYTVVTVDELMKESPFADVGRDDPDFEKFEALQRSRAVVFSDNRLRPDVPMKNGELAMLLCPKERLLEARRRASSDKKATLYRCAAEICVQEGLLPAGIREDGVVTDLPEELFDRTDDHTRRSVLRAYRADL